MLIISSGIVRVVALKEYHASKEAHEMFKNAGVELIVLTDEMQMYKDM